MQAMPTKTEKVDGIAKIPAACASTTSKYLRKKVIQVCCIEVIRIQLFRVNRIKLVRVIRIKFFRPMVSNPIVHPVHIRCGLVPFAPRIPFAPRCRRVVGGNMPSCQVRIVVAKDISRVLDVEKGKSFPGGTAWSYKIAVAAELKIMSRLSIR